MKITMISTAIAAALILSLNLRAEEDVAQIDDPYMNAADLNLTEGAIDAGFLDRVKDLGSKIVEGGKGMIGSFAEALKSIASKIGSFSKKYGPTIMKAAKDMLPKLAPIAAEVAKGYGIDAKIVEGIVGMLPKAEQEKLTKDELAEIVHDAIAEAE